MIKARCYSDDHVIEVDFDASAWLEKAADEKIIALMNCSFGGNTGADAVAEDMINQNKEIKKMFEYIGLIQNPDLAGFECHVDPEQALNWIDKYRPHMDIGETIVEHDLFQCAACKNICDIDNSVRKERKSDLICTNCN